MSLLASYNFYNNHLQIKSIQIDNFYHQKYLHSYKKTTKRKYLYRPKMFHLIYRFILTIQNKLKLIHFQTKLNFS